jgi:hypothetical protein
MQYVTHRSHQMEKPKFGVTSLGALFVKTVPVPTRVEKIVQSDFTTGQTGMHYVTHRSHRMQKHKLGVTCPTTLFIETALGPHKHDR